jgi:hypothetical protein
MFIQLEKEAKESAIKMKEYEDKMKAQQKKLEEMNKNGGSGGNIAVASSSGDAGLVEQVANIVMIRVQSDIELKIQGCLTREDFEKYTSSQEVFSSNLQRDTNGTYSIK